MNARTIWLASCAVAIASAAGCGKSVMVQRPVDPGVDAAVTALWTREIQEVARDGDWILSRSYAQIGDVITTVTSGENLSHASIYAARTGTVIESIGSGVREVPLEQLVARNHYLVVVRPARMTATDQAHAVTRARSKVGTRYDVTGLFGLDAPDRFYCSELVYWASQTEARNGRGETIVTPADLMTYGEAIYWSGKRDDERVTRVAAR